MPNSIITTSRTGPTRVPAQLALAHAPQLHPLQFSLPPPSPLYHRVRRGEAGASLRGHDQHDAAWAAAGRQRHGRGRAPATRARGRVARSVTAARAVTQRERAHQAQRDVECAACDWTNPVKPGGLSEHTGTIRWGRPDRGSESQARGASEDTTA